MIRSLGYREDKREFVPHITIARRRRGVGGMRSSDRARLSLLPNDWRSEDRSVSELEEPFTVDRLILYESLLKPGGAEYIPVKQVPLL